MLCSDVCVCQRRRMELDYTSQRLLPSQWIDLSVFATSDVINLNLHCTVETSAACGQMYEATFHPTSASADRRFHSFSVTIALNSPPFLAGVARVIATVFNALTLSHEYQATVVAETQTPPAPHVTISQRSKDPAAFAGDDRGAMCASAEQFGIDSVRIQWSPAGSLSLLRYEVAVGDGSNATRIMTFTSVGLDTSAWLDRLLPLESIGLGAKLFVSVRAVNGAGVGSAGSSTAIVLLSGAPVALRAGFGADPDAQVIYWTNTTRLELFFEAFRQPAKEDLFMRYSVSSVSSTLAGPGLKHAAT